MSKMFLLEKVTYDGESHYETVAVSASKSRLEEEAAKLNASRNENDKVYGEWRVEWEVSDKAVKVLL